MVQISGSAALSRTGGHGNPVQASTANSATRNGAMTAPSNTIRGRAKQTSQLRAAPSNSSLRSKSSMSSLATGSSSATVSSASTSATSLNTHNQANTATTTIPMLSVLPVPDFASIDSKGEEIDLSVSHTLARLLQLVQLYDTRQSDSRKWAGDMRSACLYARLALNLDSSAIVARRVLARSLLHGATLFPFGSGQNSADAGLAMSTSITHAGAHAAIEVLKSGTDDVLQDAECASIYSQACRALGRWKESGEALERTLIVESEPSARSEDLIAPTRDDRLSALTQSQKLTDASYLFLRTEKQADAKLHLRKAHEADVWNWSAWVALCDLGCIETSTMRFGGEAQRLSAHQPQDFYGKHLAHVMKAEGYDEAVIQKVGQDLRDRGDSYFYAPPASSTTGESSSTLLKTAMSDSNRAKSTTTASKASGAEPMARTASKRTVAQAIAPSPTPSSSSSALIRPGSRSEAPKRMRTMPVATSKPSNAAARTVATARNVNATAGGGQHVGGSLSGARQRALAPPTASLTNVSARVAGTLSASRTNAQARSTDAIGRGEQNVDDTEDLLKSSPRRSTRTNNPSQIVEVVEATPGVAVSTAKMQSAVPGGNKRPVAPRPASRIVQPVSSSSAIGSKRAVTQLKEQNVQLSSTTSKPFQNLVQRAASAAVQDAALWNAADAYIANVVTSLSQAYNAARNGQNRLALALLRPKGPISSSEEASLRKESALVHLPLAVEDGETTSARAEPPSAIQIFEGLPSEQRSCAEVQCLLGRAYHSLSLYHLAEKHFKHARRISPSSIVDMDIYSLTLFHLQREVELSQLSRELSLLDPNSAIAHIAAGNTYALQKEHAFALHSFQRACHAMPTHAYAFTLAGYEANELGEREKSLQYFSDAIKIDKRHWNAYAGFGQVHLQEQKIQAAAYYYGRALDLHRSNAVLWDVYGRVKMAQGHLSDAERAFTLSLRLDDRSAMSHVKLAELLLSRASVERQANVAQSYRDRAHEHLVRAVNLAPDEAHVHLMLAKSYMEKGQGHFATLLQHNRNNMNDPMTVDGYRKEPQEVDMADLAVVGYSGAGTTLMQQQQQIRATGRAVLPTQYRAEIARHLSTAVDLNPRLARYVKAMGEGARASLRGAAARLTGDMGDGSTAFDASLLPDEVTEGVTDSMIEMDDDREGVHGGGGVSGGVLEDPSSEAATELMLSETGLDEEQDLDEGEETEGEVDVRDDRDMDDSSQELAQADIEGVVGQSGHGLGLSFSAEDDDHSQRSEVPRRDDEEQDVSMSF